MTKTEKFIERKITKAKAIVTDSLNAQTPGVYNKERRYIRYVELSEILHHLHVEWMASDYADYDDFIAKEAGM